MNVISSNARFRLLGTWEAFSISQDLTVFQCANGRQVRVSRNAVVAYALAQLADGNRVIEDLVTETCSQTGLTSSSVKPVLSELIRQGILVRSVYRPSSVTKAQWSRQGHFLEALMNLSRPLEEPDRYLSRLTDARVVLVGIGGTGSLTAWLLAASGVRKLRLVDPDVVERSNLGRQFLYHENDIGRTKVEALCEHLLAYDPELDIERLAIRINSCDSAMVALRRASIAVVTGDEPRVLLNRYIDDAARELGVCHLMTYFDRYGPMFIPGASPCFRCLEAHWRSVDKRYDSLTRSYPVRWPTLPATPWGITQAAAAYCEEVVGWMTKGWPPQSLGHQVLGGSRKLPVKGDIGCHICKGLS